MIQTKWEYSANTEARRLAQTAHQIAVFFYQINGFLVLPQAPENSTSNIIIFPNLEYTSIPRFWDQAKLMDEKKPIPSDHPLIRQLETCISQIFPPKNKTSHACSKSWEQAQPSILTTINQLIPLANNIQAINIFPTQYGSIASFNQFSSDTGIIEVYLRFDANLFDLVDAILGSLVHSQEANSLKLTWTETEAICDWLLEHSHLHQLISQYESQTHQPTLTTLRTTQARHHLKKQSDDYLTRLGFRYFPHNFSIKDNRIYWQKTPLILPNHKEHLTLKKLVEQKSLSQDELADIVFESEDDYSLFTLAKFVQRLRQRLEAHGISGSVIQTVRKQGIVLAD